MIHIFNHYVPSRLIALVAAEALVLLIAASVGISLHLAGTGIVIAVPESTVPPQAFFFALGMMAVMSSMGLYQTESKSQFVGMRLALAFLLGFVVLLVASHLVPSLNPGPDALVATVVAALAGSVLVRSVLSKWNKLGVFKSRVLVLGTGSRAVRVGEYQQHSSHSSNHQVVGYVSMQEAARHYVPASHILPTAPGDSLLLLVKKYAIDQIVVAVRDRRGGGYPVQELLECRMQGVKVIELPTFFEREHRQVLLESLNPSWMVFGNGFRQGWAGDAVKRSFDLLVSGMLLLLSLPVMLVVTLCIYLESGGPILYRQQRVGQGGRIFTLCKFRSMKADAECGGTPQWASANDDRTTRVGRFIRKWRIDELPQLLNVVCGEMSLVGPRPERPYFVDQLVRQIPFYALRHSAKPGITGWAQVRYKYGASVDDAVEKLQYDLYYLKNRCLFLDLMILLATVEVVLWGKGAR